MKLRDHTSFWLSVLGLFAAFALTNPYAVLDPATYLAEAVNQAGMMTGTLDWPFTRQYIGTLPLIYMIEQQARWTLGLPLTLAAYAGLIWAGWKTWQHPDRPTAVVLTAAVTLLLQIMAMMNIPRIRC